MNIIPPIVTIGTRPLEAAPGAIRSCKRCDGDGYLVDARTPYGAVDPPRPASGEFLDPMAVGMVMRRYTCPEFKGAAAADALAPALPVPPPGALPDPLRPMEICARCEGAGFFEVNDCPLGYDDTPSTSGDPHDGPPCRAATPRYDCPDCCGAGIVDAILSFPHCGPGGRAMEVLPC